MTLHRRRFLALTAGTTAAGLCLPASASRPPCAIVGQSFDRGLPSAAHDAIKRLRDKGLSVVSFTPSGGWVVVSGDGQMESSGIPSECRSKLRHYLDQGHRINCVAFPRAGGNRWVIVHETNFFARGIEQACFDDLVKLVRTEKREVFTVAFEPGGGFSIVHAGGFKNRSIASAVHQQMGVHDASLRGIAFHNNGAAVLLTGTGWQVLGKIPSACHKKLAEYAERDWLVTQVAFEPDGGWHVSSNAYERSQHATGGLAAVRGILEQQNIPGASVSVVKNGSLLLSHQYGRVERGSCQRVAAYTRFQAASVSKVIATVGALRMAQEQGIGLDDDIRERLDWSIPGVDYAISLRMLLSHQAGLSPSGYGGYLRGATVPSTLEVLRGSSGRSGVRLNANEATRGNPDNINQRRYSGGGFTVLQRLIERESSPRTSFDRWMRDNVLDPIGMNDSGFFTDPTSRWTGRKLATNHDKGGWPIDRRRHSYPEFAAAGLYTTARDLAKLVIVLNNGGVVTGGDRLWDAAVTRQIFRRQSGSDQGLGVRRWDGYFHGGTNAGARAYLWGNRNRDQGVVALFNGSGAGASASWRRAVIQAYKDAYDLNAP